MQTYGQMTQDPTAPARDLHTYSGSVRIRDSDSGEAGRYRIPYRPYPCILETICCLPDYSDSNVPVRIKSHQAVSRQTAIWRPTPTRLAAGLAAHHLRASRGSDCSINLRVLRDRGRESVANPRPSDHQS